MLVCGARDGGVGAERDGGAEGGGVGGVAEAPDGFDFGLGEGARLFDVDEGGEGFDAWLGFEG